MSITGLKLAALYGFYPHQLGFCGSPNESTKRKLEDFLINGESILEQEIRDILKTFKNAFTYYQLIAQSNGIADPFDEKVVKAYWIGNQLLENVSLVALQETIKSFLPPKLAKKIKEIPLNAKPHHNFHVLFVEPWRSREALKNELLDVCRIGWGKVNKIGNGELIVCYQPLIKKKGKYCLDEPVEKTVFWEKQFIPEIKLRDYVAIHWRQVMQVLQPEELFSLKKYTQLTIESL